jgi:hypothetical protein
MAAWSLERTTRLLAVMETLPVSEGDWEAWPSWVRCSLFHRFSRFSNDSIGLVGVYACKKHWQLCRTIVMSLYAVASDPNNSIEGRCQIVSKTFFDYIYYGLGEVVELR